MFIEILIDFKLEEMRIIVFQRFKLVVMMGFVFSEIVKF